MSKKSFFSRALQEVDAEAEKVISSHLQNLDRISSDIKALEDQLSKAGVPFTFIYVFNSEKKTCQAVPYGDMEVHVPFEAVPYQAKIFDRYHEHCLVWGKLDDHDYRLGYQVYLCEDELAKSEDENDKFKVAKRNKPVLLSSKPLIESKSYVRLRIEHDLPHFYKAIIEALKLKKEKTRIVEVSPMVTFSMVKFHDAEEPPVL